jgi:hypothetical protein
VYLGSRGATVSRSFEVVDLREEQVRVEGVEHSVPSSVSSRSELVIGLARAPRDPLVAAGCAGSYVDVGSPGFRSGSACVQPPDEFLGVSGRRRLCEPVEASVAEGIPLATRVPTS